MHRTLLRSVTVLTAAVLLGGCEDALVVRNPNSGETDRVLGTPGDAENLLGSFYKRWSSGVYGSTSNLEGMTSMYSLMNYSSLANNCQNSHTPFTGATNFNNPGNTCQGEQYRLFSIMSEVNRVASTVLGRLDAGMTLGSTARNNRAYAFGDFLNGISLGYLSMMYDSAAVVTRLTDGDDPGVLVPYTEVFDSSMAAFQRALDSLASPGTGLGGFPLPTTWIPDATYGSAGFGQLIRSYRARIRANVARDPVERAAVDWAAVIADVNAGITANHEILTSTTVGPGNSWRQQYFSYGLWHQMPPFFIGMADTSGTYAAYIGTPLSGRGAGNTGFFLATPDVRFPQGQSRALQQADFATSSCEAAAAGNAALCKRYFRNRPDGGDQFAGSGWGWSNYDFVRFHQWATRAEGTARNGHTIFMTMSEMRLLRAEGNFRLGNFAAVLPDVNASRSVLGMICARNCTDASAANDDSAAVGGRLPALVAADNTTPVPGGTACVPKVPQAPGFTSVGCGTLWDALKYEKRIETAYTHYAPWYLDGRGWGDLPQNTPQYWAVPFQELQARGKTIAQIYGTGIGAGNVPGSASGPSAYGW